MTKTHLIIPDQHAHPKYNNKRAEWLSELINDVRPDVVVNIGDAADMPSLCSYDKGTKSFIGRSYEQDINAHLDFQEKLFSSLRKKKKKLPRRIFIEGNHDHRIKRAIEVQPELEGERFGVSFRDLDLARHYNDVVEYDGATPGIINVDGVSYSHFLVSGVLGRAISGEHPAYTLLSKNFTSCTVGHLHTADLCFRTDTNGNRRIGLVCGVFQDWDAHFAGQANRIWWRGVVVKRGVDKGNYDPEFISIDQLRKEYG